MINRNRKRKIGLVVAAVTAVVVLMSAAAWACTAHTGSIRFCSTSSVCSTGINPGKNASTWVAGSSLIASRNDIKVRYALTSSGEDACHIGNQLGSDGSTDVNGNLINTISVTTPGAGNWTFCATNGTNDKFSNHISFTWT